MTLRHSAVLALFFRAACISAEAAPAFYSMGGIDSDFPESVAIGVSSDGKVVGYSYQADFDQEAISWSISGGIRRLGDLSGGAFESQAGGISRDGLVIVGYGYNSDDNQRAFRRTSSLVAMGVLPGADTEFAASEARAASQNGSVIVGWSESADALEAFRWTSAGGMKGLGFLRPADDWSEANCVSDDGNTVAGWSGGTGIPPQAFRWTASAGMKPLPHPPGIMESEALAISSDGSVIAGEARTPAGVTHAFRWNSAAGMSLFPAGSTAKGISGEGTVIVGSDSEAVIWSGGQRVPLMAILAENGILPADWYLDEATCISANGDMIAGNGSDPDGNFVGWVFSGFNSARPLSLPQLSIVRRNGKVEVSCAAKGGRDYSLMRSADLISWSFVTSDDPGVDSNITLIDPAPLPRTYYRVEIDYAPVLP